MTKNSPYIVVIGTPDLIGGTFYGPFDGAVHATTWAEHNFPTTREGGRVWNITRLNDRLQPMKNI